MASYRAENTEYRTENAALKAKLRVLEAAVKDQAASAAFDPFDPSTVSTQKKTNAAIAGETQGIDDSSAGLSSDSSSPTAKAHPDPLEGRCW